MARHTEIRLIDDIDGEPAAETITFGIDGKGYEIDLTEAHAGQLREVLTQHARAARPLGRVQTGNRRRTTSAPAPKRTAADREQNDAIRAWGRRRGMTVADRGRIPAEVLEAYHRET